MAEDVVKSFVQAIGQNSPANLLSIAINLPWSKCTQGCDLCSAQKVSQHDHAGFSKKHFPSLFERLLSVAGANALAFYKLHGKNETLRVLQLFLLHSDATSCFQVLLSVIKMRRTKDVHFTLEQLATFLKANRLAELLQDSVEDRGAEHSGVSSSGLVQSVESANDTARSIVNLPEIVANYAASGSNDAKPAVFDELDDDSVSKLTRAGHFEALFSALHHTVSVASELLRNETAVDTRFLARLLGTVSLHAELRTVVWSTCLLRFARVSEAEQDSVTRSVVRKLVQNVPASSVRDCLAGLFDAATSHHDLAFVLGDLKDSADRRRVELLELAVKQQFGVTLQRRNAAALRNVLVLFAVHLRRLPFVHAFFEEMLARFSDRSTLQFLERAEMLYLCSALVTAYALLAAADSGNAGGALSERSSLRHSVMNKLMFGVQSNLQNARADLKALALCTTELIVNHMNGHLSPNDDAQCQSSAISKLDFELEDTADIKQLRTLFSDILHARFATDYEAKTKRAENNATALASAIKRTQTQPTDANAAAQKLQPSEKHLQAAANWLANKKTASSTSKKQSQAIDSDDDQFPQFDTSHDTPLPVGTEPKYVRELLENLLLSDSAANNADTNAINNFEASVRTAASLIRSHARSSREAGVELADALLDLSDPFSTPNFEQNRMHALVELCAVAADRVAAHLVARFFERDNSIRRRLDLLEVLKRAALRLARLDDAGVPLKEAMASAQLPNEQQSAVGADWRKIVDDRVAAKTRVLKPETLRKRQTEPSAETGSQNEFAKVAGHFYFPLLRDFGQRIGTFDLLDEENSCQLLAAYFQTVAVLHYCCSQSLPVNLVQRVARVFFDVLFLVRFHRDQDVRRNVHVALFTLLSLVPTALLVDDFAAELAELRNWLTDVIANDCNTDVRRLAQQSIVLVGTKLQEEFENCSQET